VGRIVSGANRYIGVSFVESPQRLYIIASMIVNFIFLFYIIICSYNANVPEILTHISLELRLPSLFVYVVSGMTNVHYGDFWRNERIFGATSAMELTNIARILAKVA
jgi:uncharacterized PurR-regulated membrane protein YhhQ (DUF165 family)